MRKPTSQVPPRPTKGSITGAGKAFRHKVRRNRPHPEPKDGSFKSLIRKNQRQTEYFK